MPIIMFFQNNAREVGDDVPAAHEQSRSGHRLAVFSFVFDEGGYFVEAGAGGFVGDLEDEILPFQAVGFRGFLAHLRSIAIQVIRAIGIHCLHAIFGNDQAMEVIVSAIDAEAFVFGQGDGEGAALFGSKDVAILIRRGVFGIGDIGIAVPGIIDGPFVEIGGPIPVGGDHDVVERFRTQRAFDVDPELGGVQVDSAAGDLGRPFFGGAWQIVVVDLLKAIEMIGKVADVVIREFEGKRIDLDLRRIDELIDQGVAEIPGHIAGLEDGVEVIDFDL